MARIKSHPHEHEAPKPSAPSLQILEHNMNYALGSGDWDSFLRLGPFSLFQEQSHTPAPSKPQHNIIATPAESYNPENEEENRRQKAIIADAIDHLHSNLITKPEPITSEISLLFELFDRSDPAVQRRLAALLLQREDLQRCRGIAKFANSMLLPLIRDFPSGWEAYISTAIKCALHTNNISSLAELINTFSTLPTDKNYSVCNKSI